MGFVLDNFYRANE